MPFGPRTNDDGSLSVRPRLTIPAEEIELRVTTSGGPGGQHANRSLTRVIATFRVDDSNVLSETDKLRLNESLGPVVRSSASRFRSQTQNRGAALDQLAQKLAAALAPRTPRRATKPTRGSVERRVDEKKLRGRLKAQRRRPVEE
ncbi:MAG TPA: peptide chain release factor-like protein [Acidimicrobiales bacterium]|nr:peptide chain release factor-like protein [Acidimicrobiales bacterium]